jgi:hypothetical protein
MNRSIKFGRLLIAGLVFAVTLFVAGAGLAQQSQSERELEDRDIQQRSWNLRMLSIMADQKRPQKFNPERALAQVQEDFTRIQLINKPLGLMALGKSTLDLKFVTKSATEIHKRALRLKENLALPESPDYPAPPRQYKVGNSTQLKAPIVNLARLILDFTANPFFKESGVVGPDAYQARQDLEAIIELSGSVRDLSRDLVNGDTSTQKAVNTDRPVRP